MMRNYQMLRLWIRHYARRLLTLPDELSELKVLSAKILDNQISERGILTNIQEAEFRVFSQFGEDGILQYLIRQVRITAGLRTFVEFGVETYEEANTRYLLLNNWRGLILDGCPRNIAKVRESQIYWRHGLTAVSAFIDAENINQLIVNSGYSGEIGILSIDIDGNDYWVWNRINTVNPIIVVAEYNSVFGPHRAVAVPYDPCFVRSKAHYSNLYWGCSLKALEVLGKKKGYALVGSNSAGNNAFFVRSDRLYGLTTITAEDAYVESRFRESRDEAGHLTYLEGESRLRAIADLQVVDVTNNTRIQLSALIMGETECER